MKINNKTMKFIHYIRFRIHIITYCVTSDTTSRLQCFVLTTLASAVLTVHFQIPAEMTKTFCQYKFEVTRSPLRCFLNGDKIETLKKILSPCLVNICDGDKIPIEMFFEWGQDRDFKNYLVPMPSKYF